MSTNVSRPVLRGPGPSNGARLLGVKADVAALLTFLVLCGSPHFRSKFCVGIAQERRLAPRSTHSTPAFVCFPRIHAGARETFQVVLTHRLHLGWRGSHATEFRAYAKAGGTLAKE